MGPCCPIPMVRVHPTDEAGQSVKGAGHCILGRLRTLGDPQPHGAPVELVLPMGFRSEG